jgi:hypothetical protein
VRCIIKSVFVVREGRKRKVRILQDTSDKIQIRVVSATRDAKTDKIKYTTEGSIDVVEAKAEEVLTAIRKALGGK